MHHGVKFIAALLAAAVVLVAMLGRGANAKAPAETLLLSLDVPAGVCEQLGQGYVVVRRMEVFGRVCRTGWDQRDAAVVCRALGYQGALETLGPESRCPGANQPALSNHRFWLSNVQCRGNETDLADCGHDGWGVHDCLPEERAMVRCTNGQLPGDVGSPGAAETPATATERCDPESRRITAARLYPSRYFDRERGGFLQVRVCNEWRAVCADDWHLSHGGEVACRQLGYPGVEKLFFGRPPAADRRRQAWLKRPTCNGSESYLHQCRHHGRLERQRCRLRYVAGVVCRASEWTQKSGAPERVAAPGSVRLRGGAFPSEGRLEVFHAGLWGVVCDRGFGLREANVVCRQLGFGSAMEAPHAASRVFGRGFSPIHLDRVRCTGFERRLSACRHDPWGTARCHRERISSVRCHAPHVTEQRNEVRLVELADRVRTPRHRRRGLVQVKVGDTWGPICADENWNLEAGGVACRQLGYGYAYGVFTASVGCPNSTATVSSETATAAPKPDNDAVVVPGLELLVEAGLAVDDAQSPSSPPAVVSGKGSVGVTKVPVTGLSCTGREFSLRQCEHKSYDPTGGECANCKYAAVECAYALPDLIPDLHVLQHSLHDIQYHTLASLQCAYEEGCLSSSAAPLMEAGLGGSARRALLRFTVTIRNYGTGDFRPVLERESWIWHQCHNHFHSFGNFATYDILRPDGSRAGEGHKASFCLEDTACDDGVGRRHYSCARHEQGIGLRCADVYGRDLDCQWIDITDVPDGTYTLKISTNPNRYAAELDYTNNVVECQITLTSGDYERFYTPGTVSNITCIGRHLQ